MLTKKNVAKSSRIRTQINVLLLSNGLFFCLLFSFVDFWLVHLLILAGERQWFMSYDWAKNVDHVVYVCAVCILIFKMIMSYICKTNIKLFDYCEHQPVSSNIIFLYFCPFSLRLCCFVVSLSIIRHYKQIYAQI